MNEEQFHRFPESIIPPTKTMQFVFTPKTDIRIAMLEMPLHILPMQVVIAGVKHDHEPNKPMNQQPWIGRKVAAGTNFEFTLVNTTPPNGQMKEVEKKVNQNGKVVVRKMMEAVQETSAVTPILWYVTVEPAVTAPAPDAAQVPAPEGGSAEPEVVQMGQAIEEIPSQPNQIPAKQTVIHMPAPAGWTPEQAAAQASRGVVSSAQQVSGAAAYFQPPPNTPPVPPAGRPISYPPGQSSTSKPLAGQDMQNALKKQAGPARRTLQTPEYVPPRVVMPEPAPGPYDPISVHHGGYTPIPEQKRRDGGLDPRSPVTTQSHVGGRPAPPEPPPAAPNEDVSPGILATRRNGERFLFALKGGFVMPQEHAELENVLSRTFDPATQRPGMNELVYPIDEEDKQILLDLIIRNQYPQLHSPTFYKMQDLTARIEEVVQSPG